MGKGLSKKAYADLYSVNINLITKMMQEGVDLEDRKEVRTHVLKLRRRPKAWSSGCPWDVVKDDPVGVLEGDELSKVEDLDELVAILTSQLMKAKDLDTMRTLKAKVDAIKKIKEIQILARDYIKRSEIRDGITQATVMVCSGMDRLGSELPPILDGRKVEDMREVIDEKTRAIRQAWFDASQRIEDGDE